MKLHQHFENGSDLLSFSTADLGASSAVVWGDAIPEVERLHQSLVFHVGRLESD